MRKHLLSVRPFYKLSYERSINSIDCGNNCDQGGGMLCQFRERMLSSCIVPIVTKGSSLDMKQANMKKSNTPIKWNQRVYRNFVPTM